MESYLKDLEREFGSRFISRGEIIDQYSSSPYLVSPVLSKMGKRILGVVVAEDIDDIKNLLRFCDANRIPLLARGAGTSTIGQVLPITPCIVLDIQNTTNT